MAIRIIKVDRTTEDHWDYAKRNGFWDMPKRFNLDDGDTVLFWRGGSPARVLGQARVIGTTVSLSPEEPHAWSPTDHRQYKYRVPMADFHDLPNMDVRYNDFGLTGRPDVEYVPNNVAAELVSRLSLRISLTDLAFD